MQISANRGSMICIRKSQQQDPLVRNGFGVVLLLFVCFFFVFSLPGNQGRTENTGFYRVFFFLVLILIKVSAFLMGLAGIDPVGPSSTELYRVLWVRPSFTGFYRVFFVALTSCA